jgi:hypothetical protein
VVDNPVTVSKELQLLLFREFAINSYENNRLSVAAHTDMLYF